ncbi:MAG: glycosyltransferase [Terracidiphilus sp.]
MAQARSRPRPDEVGLQPDGRDCASDFGGPTCLAKRCADRASGFVIAERQLGKEENVSEGAKREDAAGDLTIVIPVYNEGAGFARLWRELDAHLKFPFRALVVYDFDEDNTVPAVKAVIERGERRISLVKNSIRRGVVGALLTGFGKVERGPLLVVMADLSDDLAQVRRMVELYHLGNHVVVGSRYMKGGRIVNGPVLKQGLSRLAGVSLSWLRRIPTHDATNAFKIYDSIMLKRLTLRSQHGFELNLEITVKAFLAGYRITEIPSVWRDRTQGESKFKLWTWLPHYLHWYVYAFRPRRRLMLERHGQE